MSKFDASTVSLQVNGHAIGHDAFIDALRVELNRDHDYKLTDIRVETALKRTLQVISEGNEYGGCVEGFCSCAGGSVKSDFTFNGFDYEDELTA